MKNLKKCYVVLLSVVCFLASYTSFQAVHLCYLVQNTTGVSLSRNFGELKLAFAALALLMVGLGLSLLWKICRR